MEHWTDADQVWSFHCPGGLFALMFVRLEKLLLMSVDFVAAPQAVVKSVDLIHSYPKICCPTLAATDRFDQL